MKKIAAAFWEDRRFRFLLIGGWNTGVGLVVFALLWAVAGKTLGWAPVAVISHFISVANGYAGHKWLTFRARWPATWAEFARFNVSYLWILCFGMASMWLQVEKLQIHPILAQLANTAVAAVMGYWMHKTFSFKTKPGGAEDV